MAKIGLDSWMTLLLLTVGIIKFSRGEPDKADYFGNTALHLAAARGHKECVTFLINFGANMYSMDVDGHTAQELAAINGRDDILRFLDQATGKLENNDKYVVPFKGESLQLLCFITHDLVTPVDLVHKFKGSRYAMK